MKRWVLTWALLAASFAAAAADWQVDRSNSRLGFVATQQGGQFQGRFRDWRADIRFDPRQLQQSRFEVSVDVASVDTGSRERDQYLPGKDWFAAKRFPSATFRTTGFTEKGGGSYLAKGELTLRGVTRPVTLAVSWQGEGAQAKLHVETSLDRTAFGIGQGEFAGSDVVGHEVKVVADLALRKASGS